MANMPDMNKVAGPFTLLLVLVAPSAFAQAGQPARPASIAATGGDSQSTAVKTLFRERLTVALRDADGRPVAGANVTFSSPRGKATAKLGPSARVSTDSKGVAAVVASANKNPGSYTVIARAKGVPNQAVFTLTNTAGGPAPASAPAPAAATPTPPPARAVPAPAPAPATPETPPAAATSATAASTQAPSAGAAPAAAAPAPAPSAAGSLPAISITAVGSTCLSAKVGTAFTQQLATMVKLFGVARQGVLVRIRS